LLSFDCYVGCLCPTVILFIIVYVYTVTLRWRKCRDKLGKSYTLLLCLLLSCYVIFEFQRTGHNFPPVPSFAHASLDLGYRIGHLACHLLLRRQRCAIASPWSFSRKAFPQRALGQGPTPTYSHRLFSKIAVFAASPIDSPIMVIWKLHWRAIEWYCRLPG
jgi:hypothetical protein